MERRLKATLPNGQFEDTNEVHSKIMASIKSKDTKPEMVVRHLVHGLGYRYRLHRSDLPGKPDLVFSPRRKVVFVHGCFWHSHDCRLGRRNPKSNAEYWKNKLDGNVARDKIITAELISLGWAVGVVWECEAQLGSLDSLSKKLVSFLDDES